MKNYYEILEVNQKASEEMIERAYKILVKKYHPDIYVQEPGKVEQYKIHEINEAYEVLSNQILRDRYNRELEELEYEKFLNRKKIYNQETYKNDETYEKEEMDNEYKEQNRRPQVGTMGSMMSIVKHSISALNKERIKKKKQGKRKIEPNAIIAAVATIIIMLILGVIMWFIPFTNGFIRDLL